LGGNDTKSGSGKAAIKSLNKRGSKPRKRSKLGEKEEREGERVSLKEGGKGPTKEALLPYNLTKRPEG